MFMRIEKETHQKFESVIENVIVIVQYLKE